MARTYTNLVYHAIFSTARRRPLLEGPWVEELYKYAGGIVRAHGGVLDEIGGVEDHWHLLMRLRASTSLSDVVGRLKCRTSAWINDGDHTPVLFKWQGGFGGLTVSESAVPTVRRYIQNQREHHRTMDFRDELKRLLDKSNVTYDDADL